MVLTSFTEEAVVAPTNQARDEDRTDGLGLGRDDGLGARNSTPPTSRAIEALLDHRRSIAPFTPLLCTRPDPPSFLLIFLLQSCVQRDHAALDSYNTVRHTSLTDGVSILARPHAFMDVNL